MAQEILCHQRVRLSYKDAFGYVIPVGTTSLMTWVTDEGMIGTEGLISMRWQSLEFPQRSSVSLKNLPWRPSTT